MLRFAATALLAASGIQGLMERPSVLVLEEFQPYVTTRSPELMPLTEVQSKHSLFKELDYIRLAHVSVQLAFPDEDFIQTSAYTSRATGMTHIYLKQVVNDIEVFNGDMTVNLRKDGSVSSVHERFFVQNKPEWREPSLTAEEAIGLFAEVMERSTDDIKLKSTARSKDHKATFSCESLSNEDITAHLVYVQTEKAADLRLAWFVSVDMYDDFYQVMVDAENGEFLAVDNLVDWAEQRAQGNYKALHIPYSSPVDGETYLKVMPDNDTGEGDGYHNYGSTSYTNTRGNNVYAQENFDGTPSWENNERPEGTDVGGVLTFDYDTDFTQDPREYWEAAVVNLFLVMNEVKDIWYEHGFTEEAGNFQMDNFGRGGRDNDAVYAHAQDGAGLNNANFMTPTDGNRGRCRMYVWTRTNPRRDGDFDNGIIIHEFAHGLSNRLTGGPMQVNCLSGGQPGGMGEGWGDLFATLMRQLGNETRSTIFGMGTYPYGQPNDGAGIRRRRYCLSDSCNNGRFSDNGAPGYGAVHAKGELWCNFNYEVYWNLRDKHGFTEDQYAYEGDKMFYTLLLGGMASQPCSPNFIQARDAIIEVDDNLNDGDNYCELWCGYARRGMGVSASTSNHNQATNGYDVPSECESTCASIYPNDYPFGDP